MITESHLDSSLRGHGFLVVGRLHSQKTRNYYFELMQNNYNYNS